LAVENASISSPDPFRAVEPVLASPRPARCATQLVWKHRRVRRDDADARTLRVLLRHEVGDLQTHRNPGKEHVRAHAEVGEHQGADGVAADVRVQHARRRADPALEVEALHPRAGADGPLLDVVGAIDRRVERVEDVLVAQGECGHVVQERVVAFGHDGHVAAVVGRDGVALRPPLDGRVVRLADRERGRQHDRRVQQPPLGDLVGADHLAVPVQHVRRGVDALEPREPLVREDRRDAGPDGSPAVGVRIAHERRVSDADAGDVGDRVPGAGRQDPEDHAEVARSSAFHHIPFSKVLLASRWMLPRPAHRAGSERRP
jgi:hypothetical protein